ncbi:MAG: hypothetical protein AVDCRST_MAG93-6929, partial [uncultured Chloroflexia bacterium]
EVHQAGPVSGSPGVDPTAGRTCAGLWACLPALLVRQIHCGVRGATGV